MQQMIRRFDELLAIKASKTDLLNIEADMENKASLYELEESEKKIQEELGENSKKVQNFEFMFEQFDKNLQIAISDGVKKAIRKNLESEQQV